MPDKPPHKAIPAVLVAAFGIFVLGWFFFDGSTTRPRIIRSRLTLVVETPEGVRTGSGVTQTTISFPGGLTRAQGWGMWVQLVGEAVVVDLGQRGILFATLRTQESFSRNYGGGAGGEFNASMIAFPPEKFPVKHPTTTSVDEKYIDYLDGLYRQKPRSDLALKDLPVLVRFGNPNEPESVVLVDPLNLAVSFGSGVTLKRATVEVTDDPVTTGIEARLPWLKSSRFADPLFPNPSHQPVEDPSHVKRLTYNDFRSLPR